MNLKTQESNCKSFQKGDAMRVPRCWGGSFEAPGIDHWFRAGSFVAGVGAARLGGAARIFVLTVFTIGFLRFEVPFSCSFRVLKSDSILASQ